MAISYGTLTLITRSPASGPIRTLGLVSAYRDVKWALGTDGTATVDFTSVLRWIDFAWIVAIHADFYLATIFPTMGAITVSDTARTVAVTQSLGGSGSASFVARVYAAFWDSQWGNRGFAQ